MLITKNKKVTALCAGALLALGAGAVATTTTYTVHADEATMAKLPKSMAVRQNTFMPGQYVYHPKVMPGITKVHAFGPGVHYNYNNPDNGDNGVVFDADDPAAIAAKGRMGVYFENTGTYDGHQMDTKVTVLDWKVTNGGSDTPGKPGMQHKIKLLTTQFGLDEPGGYPATVARIRIDNIDHKTGEPIKVKGFYTFDDIDKGQAVGFDQETYNKINTIYYLPGTVLNPIYPNTGETLIGSSAGVSGKDSETIGAITIAYDGASSLTFNWYSTGNDEPQKAMDQDKSAAETISPDLSNNYDASAGHDVAQVSGSVNGTAYHGSWVGYGAKAVLPNKPEEPKKFVSDSDEGTNKPDEIGLNDKSVTHDTLKNRYETYHYQITHTIPEEYKDFYYRTYQITDNLDKVLENPENVHVYNEENQDVTYRFTVNTDNNKLTATAKSSSLAQDDFYGETYKVTFDAKIRPGASLVDHQDPEHKDQALIKNKPEVTVNEFTVDGNVTKTNVPFTHPEPKKEVSEDGTGDSVTYNTDFDKDYKFRIDATAPDNINLDHFAINDNIEKVQDFKSVKVYDYDDLDKDNKPKDVTDQGKLTTKDHDVKWVANDASKWHGKHLKMFITVSLPNTPDLLKYVNKDTGKIEVPNKATVTINDKDHPTNDVHVIPNPPKASVDKKIEVNSSDTGQRVPGYDIDKGNVDDKNFQKGDEHDKDTGKVQNNDKDKSSKKESVAGIALPHLFMNFLAKIFK